MAESHHIIVNLSVSADEYLKLYSGAAQSVRATSIDGRTIRFPANILQPYVTHTGVQGCFAIHFTADSRFDRIERLA
ncbi:DUF2835 domain-containing protein [Teredinibacter waterburyi]|jgi:Protein of unknown function (DUF2835).|uniref:DUF2835 domain-containing protein n=1 Tax=Teredinibacter waterburyi TaxID=1500538 RepID=UPI00165EF31D|nr:DUF2835 domain-containing protein [Teredinibacter waterburyi]